MKNITPMHYILLVLLSTFFTLLMEVGIPILIVGFGSIIFNFNFSWTPVIFLWIFIQTLLEIKQTSDYFLENVWKDES